MKRREESRTEVDLLLERVGLESFSDACEREKGQWAVTEAGKRAGAYPG